MNHFKIAIISVSVAASLAFSWAVQQRAQAHLQQQQESSRQQTENLNLLAAKNERLSNLVAQLTNSQPLSTNQLRELLVLRDEVGRLRQNVAQKTKLQASNARLQALASNAEQQLAQARLATNYWPKEKLAYAGYADPASALESMLAAFSRGDATAWWTSCTPESATNIEREFLQRGLSNAQRETEFKAMSDALLGNSAGFHIVDQTMPSADEAVIDLSFDGEGTVRKFTLKKVGTEWKVDDMLLAGQTYPPNQ